MTRPVLSSYNNIELPTVQGDSGVWGTVLNNALNQIDDLIYANQTKAAANETSIATINADANTSGSIDAKIATAVTTLRGTSTSSLSDLESLIGSAGDVDLTTINTSISNLTTNLGVPNGTTLSGTNRIYQRVQAVESDVSTIIGATTGDDAKSMRTIAGEVLAGNTGVTQTEAESAANTAAGLVQGNTTETVASLLARIQQLESDLSTLTSTVNNLNYADASTVTALQNTINGTTETIGLVTTVANMAASVATATATAEQAEEDVEQLTITVNGHTSSINTINNAGYITSSALSDYATQTYVLTRGYITAVPDSYATKNYVNNQGFLTSVPTNYPTVNDMNTAISNATSTSGSYVSTTDTNWKRVRGLFEGQTDVNRTMPDVIYLRSASSNTKRVALTRYTNDTPVFLVQLTNNSNTTYKNILFEDHSLVTKMNGMIGVGPVSDAPIKLILRSVADSRDYVEFKTAVGNVPPRSYLHFMSYHNGTFDGNFYIPTL